MDMVIIYYLKAAGIVVADFIAAWAVARCVGKRCGWIRSQPAKVLLFSVGTGALLVAGIGRLGWPIQTWSGESSSEHLDQCIFFLLSMGGTFLLMLEYFLPKESS
jgi:hypothetical protein